MEFGKGKMDGYVIDRLRKDPKIKPYHHQLSLGCVEEIAARIEENDIEEMG